MNAINIKQIEIFDIDGCICDNFFPNLSEKANIKELKRKILDTPLYPGFIEYFDKISLKKNIKIFFITGRRFRDLGSETKLQLKTLNLQDQQIIFYPDRYNHSKIQYKTFKIYQILKIAMENKAALPEFHVFDNLFEYYPMMAINDITPGLEKDNSIKLSHTCENCRRDLKVVNIKRKRVNKFLTFNIFIFYCFKCDLYYWIFKFINSHQKRKVR